ncbi:MAG: exodeoxyribonuclease VII large subunit [Candidatus Hydrogenedentes bacterium]|nr:exodeoxyribonuclease VII large subunit [Candidatus Hydrogenedentota bacterium]
MPVETPEVWTVSQLTRRVKALLEAEVGFVWVAGEISNWRVSPAGHAYFTLKDKDGQLDAVMFRGKLMRLRFSPDNGLDVVVYGQVTVYEKRGSYQVVCEEMQPKGVGALQLAFEKLKRKLADEGLFAEEHKKPLPLLPRRIGIVTSPTGAAIRDILNVINRRFANVHVILYPARVQGDEAAPEIVAGIRALDAYGVDVMIVGRGGGSLEDLWPFNEEIVVRAVYEAQTPVISAVGHEIDFTLTDFAADVRAPTPSAAAELVVREQEELAARIRERKASLVKDMRQALERLRHRIDVVKGSYALRKPGELLRERRQTCDDLRMRLEDATSEHVRQRRTRLDRTVRALALLSPAHQLRRARERLAGLRPRLLQSGMTATVRVRARLERARARLEALSPVAILERGYALVFRRDGAELVRDASQLGKGETVAVRFGKGGADAKITEIRLE